MIKILSIGQSNYSITIQVENYPVEGTKERFINKIGCGGGTASNVSYLLGKWGASTTFAGTIGNDVFGSRNRKELESVGVDTRYIETSYEKDTPINLSIVDKTNAVSTEYNVADEYVKLKKFDFDFQPDLIFSDGHDAYASKTTIDHFPKTTTLFLGSRYNQDSIDLCRKSQYIILTKEFAEKVSKMKFDFNNSATLVNIYDEIRKIFDSQIIIINLRENGTLYSVDNQIKVSPALKANKVDESGTDDAFAAAMCYGIASKWELEKSIKYANIALGLTYQKLSARNAFPKLDEVTNIYEKSN